MRNLFFWVVALGMLFISCQRDDAQPESQNGVVFSVSAPAMDTRAAGDGSTVKDLYYAVWSANEDGTLNEIIVDDGQVIGAFASSNATQVHVPLARNMKYVAIFWAQAPSAPFTLDWAEQTITMTDKAFVGQNENVDAFFKAVTFTFDSDESQNVELRRPFAQLNIGTADLAAAEKGGLALSQTAVTVPVAKTLNLLDGSVGTADEVTYALADLPTETVEIDDVTYDLISINYLLVDGDAYSQESDEGKELVDVVFSYTEEDNETPIERTFTDITIERNHRTYIVGHLLTEEVNVVVYISKDWESSDYKKLIGDETVTVAAPASVSYMDGYERVQLSWTAGEGVTKTIVAWGDSNVTEFEVTRANDVTMTKYIEDLDEGDVTFTLTNYDKDGNASAPVEVEAKVYGETWLNSLVTRPVKSVVFDKNNSQATVTFEDTWANKADCSVTTLTYTNKDGETATKQITNATTEVVCDNIALGATISITSSYKPDNYISEDTKVSPAIEKVTELIVNLRVMTLNAKNQYETWVSRAAQIANLIKDMDVDIMGLQELNYTESWLSEQNATKAFNILLNNLGSDYAGVVYEREDSGSDHEGEAIIYKKSKFTMNSEGRFWLSLTPDTAGKFTQTVGETTYTANYERFAIWSVITDIATGKEFCFANTHIDNKNSEADAATDYYLMKTQVGNMVNHIQARSSSTDSSNNVLRPIIIVGDFNANPDKSPIATMTGRKYSDTYTEAVKKEYPSELEGPYARATMHDSGTPNWAAYDYIFARGGSFTVPLHKICHPKYNNVELSDHMAVIVDMQYTFTE